MQLELTEQILKYVDDNGQVDTLDLVPVFGVDHQKIVGALKSIEANGELLNAEQTSHKSWELSDEGKQVLANGSHEAVVFNSIPSDGIAQPDLMKVTKRQLHNSFILFVWCFDNWCLICLADFTKCKGWLFKGNGSRLDFRR